MKPIRLYNRTVSSQGHILRQGGVLTIKKKIVLSIITVFFLAACQEQIDPRDIQSGGSHPDPNSPLVGTRWFWDGYGWGDVILYFENADTVIGNPGDPGESSFAYSYDRETRKGQVDTLGRFTVIPDYGKMNFSEWRHYGHGAEFTRIE